MEIPTKRENETRVDLLSVLSEEKGLWVNAQGRGRRGGGVLRYSLTGIHTGAPGARDPDPCWSPGLVAVATLM